MVGKIFLLFLKGIEESVDSVTQHYGAPTPAFFHDISFAYVGRIFLGTTDMFRGK